jgi:hypothetical protein
VLRRRPFLPPLLTLRRIAADLGPELAEVDELVGLAAQLVGPFTAAMLPLIAFL